MKWRFVKLYFIKRGKSSVSAWEWLQWRAYKGAACRSRRWNGRGDSLGDSPLEGKRLDGVMHGMKRPGEVLLRPMGKRRSACEDEGVGELR
jgi:hypothetical protein